MVKKVKHNSSSKTKKSYLGLRTLFVITWFVLVVLLTRSNLLDGLLGQSDINTSNLVVAIILLAPIAAVIFPVMYRIDDIYSISEKRTVTPAWKRYATSLIGTAVLLGILFYLFTIITFSLFYRF